MGNSSFAPSTSGSQEEAQNAALVSNHYGASDRIRAKTVSVAADRYKIQIPADGSIRINGVLYNWSGSPVQDLSLAASWDTIAGTNYTVAANRVGTNLYLWACQPASGTTPLFLASASAANPVGYTTANSRLLGGFHGLCAAIAHQTTLTAWTANTVIAAGITRRPTAWTGNKIIRCITGGTTHATTEPDVANAAVGAYLTDNTVTWIVEVHALEGYVAGDILPDSVWDAKHHRPIASPQGMVYDSKCNGWCDIYMQSGTGADTASVYNGAIVLSRQCSRHITDLRLVDKRLPTFLELGSASLGGVVVSTNEVPTNTGGRTTPSGRRYVSHIGVEDGSGFAHSHYVGDSSSGGSLVMRSGSGGPYIGATALDINTTNANTGARGYSPNRATQ